MDWLRPHLGWEDALELVFATQEVRETERELLVADGVEVRALHWVTPDELDAVMTPFGAARVRSALGALAAGRTVYTEGGEPVQPGWTA